MKMNDMLKQAQQMQARMMQIQEKLAEETVEGSAAGGLVKAVITGQSTLVELKIDPEVINPEEPEVLEDLILVAVNDGLEKSRELANSRMGVLSNALGSLGLGF